GAGAITTTTPNLNGILGGWATVGNGSAPVGTITLGSDWASVDGSGNIVSYAGYSDYTDGSRLAARTAYPNGPATNLRINGSSTGSILVDADGAASTT